MEENSLSPPTLYRSACAECQRRKQKCNREWPCNHCLKRKVADKCRFPPSKDGSSPAQDASKKRTRSDDEAEIIGLSDIVDDARDDLGLEAMGYMAGFLLSSLEDEGKKKKPGEELDWVTCETCPQLDRALRRLPSRPQMDALVQGFFSNVNYHYYIIYPAIFLQEYQTWWDRRSQNQPLALQWTCLLIMVCACATQHLDTDNRLHVELNFGETANDLTEQYHNLARELATVIPSGHYHLLNVQRMLHSIYWFKAEARFVEAWHDIGAAVREAQELGLHKESPSDQLQEFDREMRRRVWCILDTWDWQFASGLCRPTIIDHTDINVKLPNLTLEDLNPSPLLHMKLQSEVIATLAERFGAPKNVITIPQIREYQALIEAWIHSFPVVYSVDNPDKSVDLLYPWVSSHRFYIHTMAYLMILNPIRIHLAKPYTRSSPKDEVEVRASAVYYSLKNLEATTQWVEEVSHRDGRFHFIIFSLFDTATVLSTAIIKDVEKTIPRRDDILLAIHNAVTLLGRLNRISKTAKTSFDILSRLAQRVPRPQTSSFDTFRKRPKVSEVALPVVNERQSPPISEVWNQATYPGPYQGVESGSDTASPNQILSVYSATSGSTPRSHVESDTHTSPRVSESTPSSMGGHDVTSGLYTIGGVEVHGMPMPNYDIDRPAPDVIAGGTVPSAAHMSEILHHDGSLDGLPHSGVPAGYQAPQAQHHHHSMPPVPPLGEEYVYPTITDAELGDFSRLWNWQSLGLDFISSESLSQSTV